MKRAILIAALALCTSVGTFAQGRSNQQQATIEQRVEKTTTFLKSKVALSEAQWEQVNVIYSDFYESMDSLRSQSSGKTDRSKMQEITKTRNDKLSLLVGEEKLAQIQKAEADKRGSGKQEGRRN